MGKLHLDSGAGLWPPWPVPFCENLRQSGKRRRGNAAVSDDSLLERVAAVAEAKRAPGQAASRLMDERIQSLGGWRAETLAEVRRLIREADPNIMEECKWIKPSNPLGVPVWSHVGIVCTGEAYTQVVKLTFARGASLEDPRGCSTPASRETSAAPSTSGRERCSMLRC
jgi:hypothetical protein